MKFILRRLRIASGKLDKYVFYWCPGCQCAHSVPAKRWNWNRSLTSPTLKPSVRHYYVKPDTKTEVTICHYHIRDGVIEYCNDCQHDLKGQKVPLQEIPADYGIPDNIPANET